MRLSKLIGRDRVNDIIFRKGFINIRFSQLGRCQRAVQYNSFGVKQEEPSEKTKGMWKERLDDESNIIKELKKKYEVKYYSKSQKTYYRRLMDSRFILSSTPDGLIKYKDWIPLEIKSLNPFRFQAINAPEKLSREYYIQIQGEIILTNSKRGLLVIGNSKTKDEMKEIIVPRDESVEPWAEKRIEFIFKEDKWIYPEFFPKSPECRWCLFKEKCERDVYKIPKISYNHLVEIDSDDFDFKSIQETIQGLETCHLELEDLKWNLIRRIHKLKVFFIKKKASEVKVGRSKITAKGLNEILEEIKK